MVSKSRRMQHVRKKFEANDKYTLLLLSLAIFLWLQLVQFIVVVCTVLTSGYLSPPIYKAAKFKESKLKVNSILFL